MVKIKTIDVNAMEWRDKTYGNTYFSAQVYVNYDLKGAQRLYVPFQYGYGSHYEDVAFEALQKAGLVRKTEILRLSQYCSDNKIILRRYMESNCKKRDVERFGGSKING